MILDIQPRGPAFCSGGDLAKMEKAAKMTKARASAEAREGVRSFLEKRKPRWQ
ncbi:MAG TPA: hypothetical protein VLA30_13370 [Burkholderiales bacterium]|nr:hypothetical protein [Burkholderiales bacterium]